MSLIAAARSRSTAPEVKKPLKLHTLAQTVDAPVVSIPGVLSPLANASTITNPVDVLLGSPKLRQLGSPSGDVLHESYSVEFTVTGNQLVLRMACGAAATTKAFRVYVNDAPTSDYVYPSGDSQYTLTFPSSALKKVRIDFSKALGFTGVQVQPTATLLPTDRRTRVYLLGDSWPEGTAVTSTGETPGILHMGFLTGRLLDADMMLAGWGGTGYSNRASTQQNFASAARLARLVASAPDYVVIFGSINDGLAVQSTAPDAFGKTLGDYAKTIFDRIKADLPATKVMVVGVQDYSTTANTITDASPSITAAVASATNVVGYVQPLVQQWGRQAGFNVNNPLNPAHLTLEGNRYYARRVAEFIATTLSLASA